VKNPRNGYGDNGTQNTLERLERSIGPRYLSLIEREQIHDLKTRGLSIRQIGHRLGGPRRRSAGSYAATPPRRWGTCRIPHTGWPRCGARGPRSTNWNGPAGYGNVGEGLGRRWSPEQISRRLVKDFPGDLEMRVGTEAIYQAIYLHDGRGVR
jgi:hypothetical protein